MKTNSTSVATSIFGIDEQYHHMGIENKLISVIRKHFNQIDKTAKFVLMFNIDGVSVSKSSNKQFWPILAEAHISNHNNLGAIFTKPFIVGLYEGDSKPTNGNRYLDMFTNELNKLCRQGIILDHYIFSVQILFFTCNTPARQFIKCIKPHKAYMGVIVVVPMEGMLLIR